MSGRTPVSAGSEASAPSWPGLSRPSPSASDAPYSDFALKRWGVDARDKPGHDAASYGPKVCAPVRL